ncbi:MAG TPA: hypothetical protein PKA88_02505 [Polyangiaceae bacterium]|nr:hypothetical protein [Polyangiaceae bacterium]HMR75074.1 hypothetical protein [Polyangiaceae bacterium]
MGVAPLKPTSRVLIHWVVAAFGVACLTGCASVRTTGPKMAVDRCVDACDLSADRCGHPTFPNICAVEYNFCVAQCDDTGTRG